MTTPVFPTSPAPSSMTIKSMQPTLISVSHSMKRSVRSRGGQRFGFALEYATLNRAELAPLLAFALAQRGQFGTFYFSPPVIGTRRAGSGAVTVRTATASGRSIPATGPANATLAKAGDLLRFAGHSKAYMLTADAVANGSGQATLAIEPALYAAVALNEAVTLDGVQVLCAFAGDERLAGVQPGDDYAWSCELIEVLP